MEVCRNKGAAEVKTEKTKTRPMYARVCVGHNGGHGIGWLLSPVSAMLHEGSVQGLDGGELGLDYSAAGLYAV